MWKLLSRSNVAIVASAGLVLGACGSDDGGDAESGDEAPADVPTVVVTTNILGDAVTEAVGDAARVVTIMPVGADPHGFQASAQEIDVLMGADALIVNGGALEESLLDVIEAAEADGVPTFEALGAVDTIALGEGGHDHDEDHDDEDHLDGDDHEDHEDGEDHDEDHDEGDDHDHGHDGDDPHFWTDPMRMADAVAGIVAFLEDTVDVADPTALRASAEAYVAELTALNDEIEDMVAEVPDDGRKLVTNHAAYGYFADAYDFEQIGAIIPTGSTVDATSGGDLAELVDLVVAEGVPAIFSDNTASDELIQVLADEAGGVVVVELLSGSLAEPGSEGDTYLDMQRINAERITDALS